MSRPKRRSFARKFSSSASGDFTHDLPPPSPSIRTPVASYAAASKELSVTPGRGITESHASSVVTKMAVKPDVLKAVHDERVLVVGKGVVLTANVTSCDKVIVEGQFQGNIKTGTFVLSEGGQMEGEVRCADGCVGGNMKATIIASKTLMIGKQAVVTGDMVYDCLQVLDGGRLQGKLTHYSTLEKPDKGGRGDEDKEKATEEPAA